MRAIHTCRKIDLNITKIINLKHPNISMPTVFEQTKIFIMCKDKLCYIWKLPQAAYTAHTLPHTGVLYIASKLHHSALITCLLSPQDEIMMRSMQLFENVM